MKTPLLALLAVSCVFLSVAAASLPRAEVEQPAPPGGLSPEEWSGIRVAHTEWEQSFHEDAGGFTVRHPGHQWSARFDSRGFTAASDDGSWQWGLEVYAYGFPDRMQCPADGIRATAAEGSRLVRTRDANLREWYVNGPRGLEHGFTISQRPGGSGTHAPLVIELTVRGLTRASLRLKLTCP